MAVQNQYLLVHCNQYALLIDTQLILQVLSLDAAAAARVMIEWRERQLPLVDLNHIFLGGKVQSGRDCLILDIKGDQSKFIAVSVGEVSNIEAISEEMFDDIPSLAFPYNDYFDKVYIRPQTQQCIYRLKPSVLLQHVNE